VPELPEVETIRRRLEPVLVGRRFERVEIHDSRLTRPHDPVEVAAELVGERVQAVGRRGKYLVVEFESGRVLLIHLRMTGNLLHAADPTAETARPDPHRRAVVTLDNGSDVVYRDVRRFGTWLLVEPEDVDAYLGARLGAEPLERAFTARALSARLTDRRAPIKAVLLDQRTLAGMGNIYVDEALWRARVNPLTPARDVPRESHAVLRKAIRAALDAGIRRQGATLRDYRQPDGQRGRMQHEFKVYGREGEPCDRCGTPIAKTRVAGRGTWYCPRCQPPQAASFSSSRPERSRRHSSV
jgi:formamidopyrimidine-DNA glycosylase